MFDLEGMRNDWKKKLEGVTLRIQFVGIDSWNRPVFKTLDRNNFFIGDTDHLFSCDATEAEVLSFYDDMELPRHLTYFGDHAGCEPWGMTLETANIEIVRGEQK